MEAGPQSSIFCHPYFEQSIMIALETCIRILEGPVEAAGRLMGESLAKISILSRRMHSTQTYHNDFRIPQKANPGDIEGLGRTRLCDRGGRDGRERRMAVDCRGVWDAR